MEFSIVHEFKCEVVVRKGLLNDLSKILATVNPYKILVITDRNLEKLWLSRVLDGLKDLEIETQVYTLDPGEEAKDIEVVKSVWSFALANGFTRGSVILGLGGGTILDVAGFVACTFKRGMKLVVVPTTLLAQVDASIGGKNGVNMISKNIIGTFYHPRLVAIDPNTLSTLPEKDYKSGLAEVVKYGLIDEEVYSLLKGNVKALQNRDLNLLERIIEKCVNVKMEIVAKDPMEVKGDRMVLNLGHTVGHAIEAASGFNVSHGEAVAMGLVAEAVMGEKMFGFNGRGEVEGILNLLGLPTRHRFPSSKLLNFIKCDKKVWKGKLVFALPAEIGDVRIVEDVPMSLVKEALEVTMYENLH